MRRLIRVPPAAFATVLTAALLAACAGEGNVNSLREELAALRGDLQRVQKENEKLSTQLAGVQRRIGGVTEDMAQVRQLAVEVKPAAVSKQPGADAAADGSSGVHASPDVVAIASYLGTDEGKKTLAAAIQAEREARNAEQAKGAIDRRVERFAKDAGLTADQTQRMKDILGRQAGAMGSVWSSMRGLGRDATAEQRVALRQQNAAQTETLRKQLDDELRTVLSQTQYDQYQEMSKQRPGAAAGAGRRTGRSNRDNADKSGN